MNRNDIIVRRYRKDESSEIESTEYAVIKGTPNAGEALDPEVTIGDIRTGATLHEMKLYRVKIEGLNITAVEPLFNILKNMAVLQREIATTNKELAAKLPVYGTTALIETSANSYKDTTVKFGKTFSKAPFVLLTLSGGSQNTKTFAVQVKDVSTTGMTIRTVNGYSSSVSMFINWCAFPKGAK